MHGTHAAQRNLNGCHHRLAIVPSQPEIRKFELVEQLRGLGVQAGDILLVHTSFRAVRPVEGGPLGLIQALRAALADSGTLVMPSWTGSDDQPFDPNLTPASPDLGVLADTFWRMPGTLRSLHAFAFAAAGPKAPGILADPLPLPPHIKASPAGRVYESDGKVLLLGVEHDANTCIHLAETLAGVPYGIPRHITVIHGGKPQRISYRENDHCCQRFNLMNEWLKEQRLQSEGRVGYAQSRLFRARDAVRIACEQLHRDPLIFLHPESAGCEECDEARASLRR
jgi:aminoglycoside N3'-acetyltransferase